MAKRKRNPMHQLAIDTTTTGLVIGTGSVIAPTSAGHLATLGGYMPGVIGFGMGNYMIKGFKKLRKKNKKWQEQSQIYIEWKKRKNVEKRKGKKVSKNIGKIKWRKKWKEERKRRNTKMQ